MIAECKGFPQQIGYYVLREPLEKSISYVFVSTDELGKFYFQYIGNERQYYFGEYENEKYGSYFWTGPIEIAEDLHSISQLINKCPNCNTNIVQLKQHNFVKLLGSETITKYNCVCGECYLSSPLEHSEKEAINAWNWLCHALNSHN